jgi:hypothetical protein
MKVDSTSSTNLKELPLTLPQLPLLRGKGSKLMKETSDPLVITSEDEFYAQHNSQCEVCNNPGKVICCSTCTAVFHLHCVRPIITEYPPDNWRCSYCLAECDSVHWRIKNISKKACQDMKIMKSNMGYSEDEKVDEEEGQEEDEEVVKENEMNENEEEEEEEEDVVDNVYRENDEDDVNEDDDGEEEKEEINYSTPPAVVNNIPWTTSEVMEFCDQFRIFGKKWKRYIMPGRSYRSLGKFFQNQKHRSFLRKSIIAHEEWREKFPLRKKKEDFQKKRRYY